MNELRVLDLFSGIGGFSLGLKRAGGFRTVAYCEIEPYCQKVLQARMRDGSLDTAPICTDIRKLDGKPWRGRVDLICGGFPCQDISNAGRHIGIGGERSGLWSEYARLIGEIRPRFIFVENVAALLGRGLERVLADMASCGYDAEWDCIPASAVGANHRRDRIWIVAYASNIKQFPILRVELGRQEEPKPSNDGKTFPNTKLKGLERHGIVGETCEAQQCERAAENTRKNRRGDDVPNPVSVGQSRSRMSFDSISETQGPEGETSDALDVRIRGQWAVEPNVGRVANGIPSRVDRLTALGNAVVPQVVEWIGQRIVNRTEHRTNG